MKKTEKTDRYVVIMAGGNGSRLWPMSRKENPKQFQYFTSEDKTLIQETFERIRSLVSIHNIYISTTASYVELVKEQLPEIDRGNIIVEPCGRDTAPALAYVSLIISTTNPNAIILTTPSDHTMKDPEKFIQAVETGFLVAELHPDRIGLVGIKITEPSTALGYIKTGSELVGANFGQRTYEVDGFKEKPDIHTAREYFYSPNYFWNAAYFIFSAKTMLEKIRTYAKDIDQFITEFEDGIKNSTSNLETIVTEQFSFLEARPIDTVVLEKLSAKECFVVPASLRSWSDVGTWNALYNYHCEEAESCTTNITRGKVVSLETKNCLIFSNKKSPGDRRKEHTIATFGIEDLIIVHYKDVTLVAHKKSASDIKDLMKKIKDDGCVDLL